MSFQQVFGRNYGHLIPLQSCIQVTDPSQQLVMRKRQIHLSAMALVNQAFTRSVSTLKQARLKGHLGKQAGLLPMLPQSRNQRAGKSVHQRLC